MGRPCVIFGREEPAGAAFAASGCASVLDFLSSTPLLTSGDVQKVELIDWPYGLLESDCLYFVANDVRDREEAREAGSFVQFLHALPCTSCTQLSLRSVKFVSEEEIYSLFTAIGSPLCKLCDLWIDIIISKISFPRMDVDALHTVVKDAFSSNSSLRSLYFIISRPLSVECLIPTLRRTPCSIQHLSLFFSKDSYRSDNRREEEGLCEIFRGLASNDISLTTLEVANFVAADFTNQLSSIIGTVLQTNKSLESLSLRFPVSIVPGGDEPSQIMNADQAFAGAAYMVGSAFSCSIVTGRVVESLFDSLEHNTHLTHLSLRGCGAPDWPPTASFILDSLRVNGTLSSLDLRDTPLEGKSAAAIDAQLARNKQRVENQLPALDVEASRPVRPSTLRLFLCGLPFSGKTTLSRSLVRWNASTAFNLTKCFSCTRMKMLTRTRGIEISSLEKDGVRISLWDLAGQPEYYAFHDQMFPDLSSDATPSLFLFVWSPVELNDSTGKAVRDNNGNIRIKALDLFENDFRYWLRFIASKTLKSLKFKPKLFIVITRADLVQPERTRIKNIISTTFQKCRNDFQNHIEININWVFEMDAREPSEVDHFGHHLFHHATLILQSKPFVYKVCNEARREIAILLEKKLVAPLVRKKEFFFLCKKQFGLMSEEMQEAVALSLNESGDLIYFKELELVVMNTQWFCHDFMGNLLRISDDKIQHGGFFSPQYLEDLVEKKVNSLPRHLIREMFSRAKATKTFKIKGGDLVTLLIGLQLACKQDDGQANSIIFIPASLCTKSGREVDPCTYLNDVEENNTFMGRRLMCKDSICTFFTQGIFTILQVTFQKLLGDQAVVVHLEEDVMVFAFGGVKVLMEFYRREGRVHFIDILVSSAIKDRDATLEWLQENVILDVEKICGKPRGMQGVELAHAVIQPASIQSFWKASARPAVLIEKLQDELKSYVEKKGVDEGVKTAMYTWQIDGFPSNSVAELLGEKETLKVIRTYLDALSAAHTEISGLFINDQEAESSQPQKPQFGMSPSSKERESIFDRLCTGEQTVTKKLEDLKLSIGDLHNAVQDLRNAVLSKLREIFTFVKEGEAGKLPRMFLVTENDGLVQRVVSAIVPGLQNVRLQLFCECRSAACHFVDGKRGMSLASLDEGLLRRGLPYINALLKAAYVASRVAAHVAVGSGGAIHDFTKVLANIVDAPVWNQKAPSITYSRRMADVPSSGSRVNCKEGQQWLFDVLSSRNCTSGDRIYEEFGLRRIRLPGSVAAWVCDRHYGEGTPWPA